MAIVRWDPFRDLMSLQDEVNSLFRRSFLRGADAPVAVEAAASWAPALDVHESAESITVEVELPGMEARDIEISLEEDILRVRGERKFAGEVKGEDYHRMERAYGRFERSIPLPRKVEEEKVTASVKDGVLSIVLPKAVEAAARRIPVRVEEEKE